MLGEYNYSHSSKGELLCVRDKAYSPFNECTILSPPTNSHMASLLLKRQNLYAYKCVRVIVLYDVKNEIEINCIQQVLNVWMTT